jgi:hypothetical protein
VIDAEANIPANIQALISRLGCGKNFKPLLIESPIKKMYKAKIMITLSIEKKTAALS